MQNSGLTVAITDCGVTPQAQKCRQLVVVDWHRVAVIWIHRVGNADQFRLADVHRRAVHGGKARGDLHRADRPRCARPLRSHLRMTERCYAASRAFLSSKPASISA
jgi:hypothetical protein